MPAATALWPDSHTKTSGPTSKRADRLVLLSSWRSGMDRSWTMQHRHLQEASADDSGPDAAVAPGGVMARDTGGRVREPDMLQRREGLAGP